MKRFLIFLIVLLIISGCKFSDIFKKKETDKGNLDKEYNITVPVTVSKSVKGTLVKHIKVNGTAEAISQTDIISQVSGNIDTIYVKDNSMVKIGDKIMEIDRRNILLDIKQAQLEFDKAKALYEAWKNIKKNLSDKQLKIQTGLIEKQIRLNKLRLALEKATIKAPFTGIIYNMKSVKGEYVSAGEKLFSIVDNSQMTIRVYVLESEIDRIKTNANVSVYFPAIQNRICYGKVESISPTIDKDTHSCEVTVKISNDNNRIKNGMYAQVKIDAEKYPDRILVYKDAILVRNGKKLVFAVEDNRAKWQYVKTGEENEYFVEITEGVKDGQDIVIQGNFALSHDAKVKIVKEVKYKTLAEMF